MKSDMQTYPWMYIGTDVKSKKMMQTTPNHLLSQSNPAIQFNKLDNMEVDEIMKKNGVPLSPEENTSESKESYLETAV